LARHGFRPTVVERAPQLRGGGYAVDFRGSAHLSVLTKMGVLDRIRDRQTHLSATTYVDADGRPVASMPAGIFAGDVEILRGDLGRILYEATRDSTEYLFGDSITGLHRRPSTWSSGQTDCTPPSASWPSTAARTRSTTSACTSRSSASRIVTAWTTRACCTACPAGPRRSSARRVPTGRWRSSSLQPRTARPSSTTTTTPPSSRRSWPAPSRAWTGTCQTYSGRCPRRPTSTSTR